jgi:hypothetical protein
MDLETNTQVGDFLNERRLGVSGMAVVYQSRQVSLQGVVAFNVLGPGPGVRR